MASPLRWFRKHSFFFIVVFGVFLMAIFGLGSVITGLNPGDLARRTTATNQVLAEWSGGELKQQDVAFLRQRHFAAQRLIEEVYKYALAQNGGNAFRVGVERILPIVPPGTNPSKQQMDIEVMNRYLMAKRAKEEGFIVDENMVMDYLAQYSGDAGISKNILKQLNKRANPAVPLTPVVRQLQDELLWQQMESITRGGLAFNTTSREAVSAINPTEAVELFGRTNKTIECKVFPVPVEEYVSKITGEPSETELRDLYEKGKYDYPSYNFKEPGFKERKKGKIQYFVANLDTFLQNEMAKLTDEQVQEEYDRLVEAEDRLVMRVVPETTGENSDETGAEQDAKEPVDDDKVGESSEDSLQADSDSDNADEDNASRDENSEENVLRSESNTDKEQPASSEEGDASSQEGGGSTSLNLQDEPAESPTEETPAPRQDPSSESDESTTDTESDSPESNRDDNASSGKQDTETAPATTQDSDPVIDDKPKIKREPKPLKDVVEDVKRSMVMEDARKARDKAIDSAEREIRKFQMMYDRWEHDLEGNKDETEAPAPPNYQEIADKYGIQFAETGFIDETQIADEELGQVVVFDLANRRAIQIGEQLFQEFDNVAPFQPLSADDFRTSSRYLYWFSEKVEQQIPEFENVRNDLVEFWKRNQAVDLAMNEAKKIAEQVNSQQKLLSDLHPEKTVDTGGFSWFSKFGRFSYGAPIGVTEPGEDLMEVAFALKEREAAAAMNDTRDTAYVIQNVTPLNKSTDQIASDYLNQHFFQTRQIPQEVVTAKRLYRQRMNFDWTQDFRKSMDVKFIGH